MKFRLKTNTDVGEKLKDLHNSTGLTPNILSRLAIALSLLDEKQPKYIKSDSEGLEFNRTTLTGEYDVVYKSLIKQHYNKDISDKEYFPDLFNAHLHRGVNLLYQKYEYAGNYDRFIDNLLDICFQKIEEN